MMTENGGTAGVGGAELMPTGTCGMAVAAGGRTSTRMRLLAKGTLPDESRRLPEESMFRKAEFQSTGSSRPRLAPLEGAAGGDDKVMTDGGSAAATTTVEGAGAAVDTTPPPLPIFPIAPRMALIIEEVVGAAAATWN